MARGIAPLLLTLLALSAAVTVHAACLAEQGGRLAPLEQLAFNQPRAALAAATATLAASKAAPASELAALNAIAAEAARQIGLSKQSAAFADTGLALLPPDATSDLAVRLRTVRAFVSTNLGGMDAAIVDLNRLAESVKGRPLALGCILRDRGWLHFRDGDTDQALDDLLRAWELLRRTASPDEAMVVSGRLSMAQFSVHDYAQALTLVDESIAFFRRRNARLRLATALDRRASILTAADRFDEALVSANEALKIHSAAGDRVGTGQSQLRLCAVEAARHAFGTATMWCDAAEATLKQTSGVDDNDERTLAALRGKVLLDQGKPRQALSQLDFAAAPGGAVPAFDLTELHAMRARALAALGNYKRAYAMQSEYLRGTQQQFELDRMRELTRQRARFENDRQHQRLALLQKDSALAAAQLQSQQRATRLAAIAGLAALLTALALGYALLANRKHRAQLIDQAERDYLTGLPNRRAIVRAGVQALKVVRGSNSGLVLALIDLDHFKHVNDRYGHAVGDKLLQRFAFTSRAVLGSQAQLGRYGGEEFLLVFGKQRIEDARALGEQLREAICATSIDVEGTALHVTLSMGLAQSVSGDEEFDQLARRADAALYLAKTRGRNRVEVYEAATVASLASTASLTRANARLP